MGKDELVSSIEMKKETGTSGPTSSDYICSTVMTYNKIKQYFKDSKDAILLFYKLGIWKQ